MLKAAHLLRAVFTAALLFICCGVAAQTSCAKPQVFYVNGVWNGDQYMALASATGLTEAAHAAGAPGLVNVRTIWSPGDGPAADLVEVFIGRYWNDPSFVDLVYAEIIARFSLDTDLLAVERYRAQIARIKSQVLPEITTAQVPVVMVAHSQGNIMVNQAIQELQSENASLRGIRSIGILGIANADKRANVSDFYRYITSSRDQVIKAVPSSPAANFFETQLDLDLSGHTMGHYLSPEATGRFQTESGPLSNARAQVGAQFVNVYDATQASWPCLELGSSPNPAVQGQAVAFSVSVKARPGDERKPEGIALVREGEATLCSVVLDASGGGICSASFSEIGTHGLMARYTGSGPFRGADSNLYLQTVTDKAPLPSGEFRAMRWVVTSCQVGSLEFIRGGQQVAFVGDAAFFYHNLCAGVPFPTQQRILFRVGSEARNVRIEHSFGCEGNTSPMDASGSLAITTTNQGMSGNVSFQSGALDANRGASGAFSATGSFLGHDPNGPTDIPYHTVRVSSSGTWTSSPTSPFPKCLAPTNTVGIESTPNFCSNISTSSSGDRWGCDFRPSTNPPRPGEWSGLP